MRTTYLAIPDGGFDGIPAGWIPLKLEPALRFHGLAPRDFLIAIAGWRFDHRRNDWCFCFHFISRECAADAMFNPAVFAAAEIDECLDELQASEVGT